MYNPFNKKINELVFDDLKKLIENEVKEGYYVEFKSDFQTRPAKIAKSIASFANTYGGWYFIGVKDEENINIATEIVGFDINNCKQPIEKIRQIAREHIHPIPFFEIQLLKNDAGKHVIVLFIPESFETPHILSDGVVYLRNGEISEPVANDDRYTLTKLYEKSSYLEAKINSFLKPPFGATVAESDQNNPFVNIYLFPKRFYENEIEGFYEDSFIEEMIDLVRKNETLYDDFQDIDFSLSFKNVMRTPHSLIFRDISNGYTNFNPLIEFFYNGVTRIRIPISFVIPSPSFNKNKITKAYYELLCQELKDDIYFYKLVDLCRVFMPIRFATKKYSSFIHKVGFKHETFIIVEMKDIFQLIPFVESDSFLDHCKKYHIPSSIYQYKKIPDELSPNKRFIIEDLKDIHVNIFRIFLMGLGLPESTQIFIDSLSSFFKPFFKENDDNK